MERKDGESRFEYKLRLCLAKLNKEIDLDWAEIAALIGEDVSADHLRKTAYGFKEYFDYIHNGVGVANRILSISDTHVPYQLPLTTFKDYIDIVDTLVLNGDLLDMQSLSKFPKMYRISFMEELIQGRQYLIDLIEYIKPKSVHIVVGNHDARMGSYLAKNIDSDILELMPNNPLDLIVDMGFTHYDKRNKTRITYEPIRNKFNDVEVIYDCKWWCRVGESIFCHPLAFSSGTLKTTEKALTYFNSIREYPEVVVMAHTHKLAECVTGGVYLYEQGTCSRIEELDYMDGRLSVPQQKGFIYLCHDDKGKLIKEKTKLIKVD